MKWAKPQTTSGVIVACHPTSSHTRERGDDCRQHIGMDGGKPVLFEHCTDGGTE